jgi:hypothetical protein
MPLDFVLSEKGKQKLRDGAYLFIKDKISEEKVFWKCDKSDTRGLKCRARVHSSDDEIIKRIGEHNHVADAAANAATELINDLKNQARLTQDAPHRIVAQASVGLSPAIAAKLPIPSLLKRTINRTRNAAGAPPPNPQTRLELQMPPEYCITENNEPFLLFDSGENAERILIFGTRRNLAMLALSQHWYADGTFKTVPLIFEQLYTIHGIRSNTVIPAVFALLPNKTQDTYERLFAQLKQLEPALAPQSVMTDFERAAINAMHAEFPETQHRGCFFHFNQCIYRKIQEYGLQRRYETDPDFALTMKMLPALAFMPMGHVVNNFQRLTREVQFPEEALEVVDYFEDTWIGRPTANGRRAPRFSLDLWNVFDAVVDGLPKTNNACEGWHRGFMELVGGHHPTIWKFFKALKLEQSKNEMVVEQYLAGQAPPAGKKKYRDCAARIQRIVAQYDDLDPIDFLRALAHNFNF